ncbi:MAG: sulfatase-like hydrolase/transferase ['Candidatus Kapabacteria' thiocyanatum]|uniref:Sulfatase N-terminal domain-containing protein n=1 Tax=Candidatus Kapaibacterium thiocyanatum TaxID=1895771 RepID=A0A1M3KWP3_9BACT|nr:sulfatase-like hydrolase/transferase ['Candidatus Kapabacteria' thiocyanatum]OJX56795.1 MAG: hypothetical protein BGO89_09695 ['Candidatus Kapabacteria' thiocyanatum]
MNRRYLHISYLLTVYGVGLVVFLLFRALVLFVNLPQLDSVATGRMESLLTAFWMGLRFDTVISCYILALPLAVLSLASIVRLDRPKLYAAAGIYLTVFYGIAFFICAADVPYMVQYRSRITVDALQWADNPAFMIGMIVQEARFGVYLLVFCAVIGAWIWAMRRTHRRYLPSMRIREERSWKHAAIAIGVFVPTMLLCILGIRGRWEQKSPIRVGTAFATPYAFTNQLGLNPVFTFLRSWMDARQQENRALALMPDDEALREVRRYMCMQTDTVFDSPLARTVAATGQPLAMNVVLVIMEGMSADYMRRQGHPTGLTPVLDSLASIGMSFDSIYSAGIHTHNGIYGTLFSFPSMLRRHPMNGVKMNDHTGFAVTLKEFGYRTAYFTTHDDQFDNVGGFLRWNGFDEIFSQQNYPSEKVLSVLGVPDHEMFAWSLPVLDRYHAAGRPFFTAFMTTSNHGPYILPQGIPFTPKSEHLEPQMVEYSDWAIGTFMHEAAKRPWFRNTMFVFVADHGGITGVNPYDVPLSYHHSPFIVLAPGVIRPSAVGTVGGQIDVFPTIMGLLRRSYVNNTMGVDLLRERRPFIFITEDDRMACLDAQYLFIHKDDGAEGLYRYRTGDVTNYLRQEAVRADSMRRYMFSMMQGTQYVLANDKAGRQRRKQRQ